jgi:1-acyl-sn-glycerol-3-phosphate acyltransferase
MKPPATPFARTERSPIIGMLRCANACLSRMYHHVELCCPCQLPRRGPALLVCNHLSGLDPVLIQSVAPRLIRWMMAKEYYEQKSLKWLLDLVGAIPVDRSGRDRAATRAALEALASGYVVGVFPEGRIETSRQLLPFQNGIALLAAKSGAPVYPVYMEGTQRGKKMLEAYLFPCRASLAFGPPLHFDRSQVAQQGLAEMACQVRKSVDLLRIKYDYHCKNRLE